jgi:hypothetical protein
MPPCPVCGESVTEVRTSDIEGDDRITAIPCLHMMRMKMLLESAEENP